jgi:hypothetical protein
MDEIIKKISDQFGKGAGELAGTYLPTLRTMGLQELVDITKLIEQGKNAEAHQKLLDGMTLEELAKQKETLAQIAVQMANQNAASHKFWNDMVSACLKVALGALIPVVGL